MVTSRDRKPTVLSAETVSASEIQQVEDPPTLIYRWTIEDFSRLETKKLYSQNFHVGGYEWRVLIFPKGNDVDYLSIYLDVADSATLPYGWSRYAKFSLAVVNQIHGKHTILKSTQHHFNGQESDWGFTSFMSLSELYDPSRGYLVDDTCVIEAKVIDNVTGYVGLKKQGATDYMNSLLQTLYYIRYFRKAIYHIPTTEDDMPSGSIPLALQSLFYKLQYSDNSVATKELTKSFGWDTDDSFMQHDVQELNRVLCEKLEDKMKGTVVEGTIQHLFEGHYMNYIECINVNYKSAREESFYDLQLDVKGCRDVYASFDKYVKVERLEGDNKYQAENLGLQDAKKGVLFIDFPPVLQLHLKRFEFDFMQDTSVKINDRYEFPLQLDLDKYLSPGADRTVRNVYTLHSVLVHSGMVLGGHYYAFIRPTLSHQWFKFDNEKVTEEDTKKALEEHYGGGEELPQTNPGSNNTPFTFTKYSNAYMLVYIRESDKEKIMCDVDEKDIAEHLRIRLKKEQEEKEHKKKEKAEAQLYTIIKVARNEDLMEQIGKKIIFDLVDHDKVRAFRIQNQMSFNHFKEEVFKEFGIPVQFQRFWLWAKRQNHTYRPNRPLTPQEETQSVGQLREISNKTHNAELKLFLEVEIGPDRHFLPLPPKMKEEILLFFKLYDPEKEDLKFVGKLFVKSLGKPTEIVSKLTEMAEFPPNEEIDLYEEIKFEPNVMCEHIDRLISFKSSELDDGDIICYQKSLTSANRNQFRYPDVPSFLEYVRNRRVVFFRALEKPKEEAFSLELSKLFTYDDVVESVACQLGVDDPSKIRLTSHNCYFQQPKSQPIKYRGVDHLSDMLVHYNQTSDILYYEILDIPLPELQGLKTLTIAFRHATKDEVANHNIRLPKNSTVADVINDLRTKVELSRPDADVRLLGVFYHKIYKIFPSGEKIENINSQYWTLRVEEIPEEEKRFECHDRLIHGLINVHHFTRDSNLNQMQVRNFGEPFFLVIKKDETLADIKIRIQKKLQVADDEFSKWKFALISLGRPEYLQDSDIVSDRFLRRDIYGAWKQYLGLEHSDTAPKKAYTSNPEKLEPNVMCEDIDKRISIKSSQLKDGDITCYQKSLTSARYPNDPSFLEYVRNHQNMDTNLVAVTKRRRTDVDPSSSPVVPSSRNLQPDSSLRDCNSRNLKPEELHKSRLYKENSPCVVRISNLGARQDVYTLQMLEESLGFGAGFIWDRIGHIVTNYHVIHGAFKLRVTLADQVGTSYDAKVVGCDQGNDVAVLRIDAPWEKLRPIKVGTSADLCVGLDVFAIGHPFGLINTCIPGVIISGPGVWFTSPVNGMPILDAILTNALINPGNSGGPLLDSSGYLIGIVTAIYSQIGESCGISFAVPVDTVKRVVELFV